MTEPSTIPSGWEDSFGTTIAARAGRRTPDTPLSPVYFSRLCKQSTGLSPYYCPLQQRIERAKKLLADPRRRIAEVSDALGFPHQSHFTTTFHTLVGMTPRAYQRQRGRK